MSDNSLDYVFMMYEWLRDTTISFLGLHFSFMDLIIFVCIVSLVCSFVKVFLGTE